MRRPRNLLRILALVGLATGSLSTAVFPTPAGAALPVKPNVLFIAVDDLNHWVGHLGRNPQTKTPNIDRLAQRGRHASRGPTVPRPVCNPSRAALMSGLRPSTTGVYDNGHRLASRHLRRR